MMNKDMLDEQIECAIRERGAINHFQELENQRMVASVAASRPVSASRKTSRTIRAIAASVAVLVCVGCYGVVESSLARSAFNDYVSMVDDPARSADSEYDITKLEQQEKELEEEFNNPTYEEPEYKQQLDAEKQDIQFKKALSYMHHGKFLKAKKILKRIAEEGGIYSDDAKGLLKKF